jgi:DNA replication licensing factor MCM2
VSSAGSDRRAKSNAGKTGENSKKSQPPKREIAKQGSIMDDSSNEDDSGRPRQRRRLDALAARRRQQQRAAAEAREELLDLADGRADGPLLPIMDDPVDDPDDDDDDGNPPEDDVDDRFADVEEEEEEDGEDLLENAARDYQRIDALDTYGPEGLDDENEYDLMTREQRLAAEQQLNALTGRRSHVYDQLIGDEDDEDAEARRVRRGMFRGSRRGKEPGADDDAMDEPDEDEAAESSDDDDLDGDDPVNLEAFDVPLREWIAQDRTRREIQRRFRKFLKHYDNNMYEKKIRTMCANNQRSIVVIYEHVSNSEPILAMWLADAPADMLAVLDAAATRHTISLFPSYRTIIASEIRVRIANLPVHDSLRDLRNTHLHTLVHVSGVVTRRNAVTPQLHQAVYVCSGCKGLQGPFLVSAEQSSDPRRGGGASNNMPTRCPNCEKDLDDDQPVPINTTPKPFFRLHPGRSTYRNTQRIMLQEAPGSVLPGRVPRTKTVILSDDLIDGCRPGEHVDITGIYTHAFDYKLTYNTGFPVFSTHIVANYVHSHTEQRIQDLTEQDIRDIQQLAKDPRIAARIVQSMAPSIYGHDHCKLALALSLFGGVAKQDKHRIRGDINVLLLGDPGTAKSQLLKYVETVAPRAVYSTGKGASAVGLTASVHKDPITKEWTLEGGALVLADTGMCLIDEFDKMNEQDRTSIHEAMEQQSISVSKAGIVTSLQARCAVIAAANPIGGRYDSAHTLADNVELTDPIIQRFDILCVLQDEVDPVADERLAKFVTGSHMKSVEEDDDEDDANGDGGLNSPLYARNGVSPIPQALLRKYIEYARTNIQPVLRGNALDQEKVSSLYVALRRESAASGGVPIAVRHSTFCLVLLWCSLARCTHQPAFTTFVSVLAFPHQSNRSCACRKPTRRCIYAPTCETMTWMQPFAYC